MRILPSLDDPSRQATSNSEKGRSIVNLVGLLEPPSSLLFEEYQMWWLSFQSFQLISSLSDFTTKRKLPSSDMMPFLKSADWTPKS
jgi:hypothetical protein